MKEVAGRVVRAALTRRRFGRVVGRENLMATIDVLDLAGSKVGSLELADEVFGAINEDLLWEAVKHYRAGLRAGTHATKNRKLVSGCGQEAVAAEGNRARPCRVDSFATMASRRHDSRTAAPLL